MIYQPREMWRLIVYRFLWEVFWVLVGLTAFIVILYGAEMIKLYLMHIGIIQPWMLIDHGDCTGCL